MDNLAELFRATLLPTLLRDQDNTPIAVLSVHSLQGSMNINGFEAPYSLELSITGLNEAFFETVKYKVADGSDNYRLTIESEDGKAYSEYSDHLSAIAAYEEAIQSFPDSDVRLERITLLRKKNEYNVT